MKNTKAIVSSLLAWFADNARDLPWRHTRDPYAVWISEIMLQQTQVKTVIPYWLRWMEQLPDIQALANAKPESVLKLWEGLGYYSRARNLQKSAQLIVDEYSGRFPCDHAEMLKLPGIGRYTAGAIASIAFNEPQPILDGNVIRVLTRVMGFAENPHDKASNNRLWQLARQLVDTAAAKTFPGLAADTPRCSHLNQSLMELGALICTPRQPQCLLCPLQKQCDAFRTGRSDQLPNLGERAKATAVFTAALVIEAKGKFLIRRRGDGEVNHGLWEFPNLELKKSSVDAETLNELMFDKLGLQLADLTALCTIKHSITRYRITLHAWRGTLASAKSKTALSKLMKTGHQWASHDEMTALPFTSAHKKILKKLT